MGGFHNVVGTHEEGKLHHVVRNVPGLAKEKKFFFSSNGLTLNQLVPD